MAIMMSEKVGIILVVITIILNCATGNTPLPSSKSCTG